MTTRRRTVEVRSYVVHGVNQYPLTIELRDDRPGVIVRVPLPNEALDGTYSVALEAWGVSELRRLLARIERKQREETT